MTKLVHAKAVHAVVRGLIMVLLMVLACSCQPGTPEIRSYDVPKAPPAVHQQQPAEQPAMSLPSTVPAPDLKWDTPAGWRSEGPTAMRVASFVTPGNGTASIVVLGGDAGGLVANVNRWRGQLGLASETEQSILAATKSARGPHGEFRWLRILGGGKDRQGILAAVISRAGNTVFVKLSASSDVLDQNQDQFLSLSRSIRFEKKSGAQKR